MSQICKGFRPVANPQTQTVKLVKPLSNYVLKKSKMFVDLWAFANLFAKFEETGPWGSDQNCTRLPKELRADSQPFLPVWIFNFDWCRMWFLRTANEQLPKLLQCSLSKSHPLPHSRHVWPGPKRAGWVTVNMPAYHCANKQECGQEATSQVKLVMPFSVAHYATSSAFPFNTAW